MFDSYQIGFLPIIGAAINTKPKTWLETPNHRVSTPGGAGNKNKSHDFSNLLRVNNGPRLNRNKCIRWFQTVVVIQDGKGKYGFPT